MKTTILDKLATFGLMMGRKAAGLTREEMALDLGMTVEDYNLYEDGVKRLDQGILLKLNKSRAVTCLDLLDSSVDFRNALMKSNAKVNKETFSLYTPLENTKLAA